MLQSTHRAFSPCIGVYARVNMAGKERFQHLEAADGARREARLGLQSTMRMSDTSHTQTHRLQTEAVTATKMSHHN